jgi:dipeptidyl aminopeptidase/acylaminoacyl peptidase
VRVDSRGRHRALTAFNSERVKDIDLPPFREFWFENSQGRRVHSWLALPPGFDETRKYPLVLQIHGGPFSSSKDSGHVRWHAALLAAPGYVVLMTDYTGSVGYGEAFSRAIGGDPLKTPGLDLLQAADVAIERYPFIDASRQAATGASYGGHLVNWLQGTTTRFKTLVGHAGLVDLEGQYSSSDTIYNREIMNGGPAWGESPVWREQSPSTYADNWSTPMMLTIGEKDFRVPVNQTIAAWSYLKRKQVPGRLLVFHDANHWIMKGEEARYFWQEVHAWLGEYLLD